MITSQVSYYVWKMRQLQTIETLQKTKQKQLKVRIKLSVDARTLKNLASPLRYWIIFI